MIQRSLNNSRLQRANACPGPLGRPLRRVSGSPVSLGVGPIRVCDWSIFPHLVKPKALYHQSWAAPTRSLRVSSRSAPARPAFIPTPKCFILSFIIKARLESSSGLPRSVSARSLSFQLNSCSASLHSYHRPCRSLHPSALGLFRLHYLQSTTSSARCGHRSYTTASSTRPRVR